MYKSQLRILSILLFICLAQVALAGNWPQFRGPSGLGISQDKGLPVTWTDTENIAWKTALPGYGSSSPIALDDKLYVTCYSGYGMGYKSGRMEDLKLHLVCVDAAKGNIIWDKPIKPSLPESSRVRDHGYAAATPATDGKDIYVFFGRSGVFKFDLKGNQIWQTSVGTKTHAWGSGTSPVLYKDLVIVNASVESKALVAINKATGKEAWRAEGMISSWNTPHLIEVSRGKHELAVSVKGFILGFDPATGKELWRCQGIPDYICPSIISNKGVLYAIGGRSSKTIAVKSGGRGDVTKTHKLWQADVGANVSSPVFHDNHLYWVSDRNKVAYCISTADGSVKYAEDIKKQPYASTLLADGRLYIVTRNDGTIVLSAKPKFEQVAYNKLNDKSTFNASPIVCDGTLIMRSDENLYCIKKIN
ncbi:MAG: PQQ-binding-like beta-propeller repeat protein [Anaerohalosphaera sp.]|nr:PQQ-binding-like beta-propeller repeat protein [Anaerohalosphaera sp.]